MQMTKFTKDTNLVVLTGAGISAESGIKTFRESGGLWEEYRIEDVATPQAWQRSPGLVWEFYNKRRQQAKTAEPNAAHYALVELEEFLGSNFTLITQNVDGLHKTAGSKNLIEMHGNLFSLRCENCMNAIDYDKHDEQIFRCSCGARFRPNIVWFGEMPYALELIDFKLSSCDYFLVVGTSGVVYPAASFLSIAANNSATTIGINLDPPENVHHFNYFYPGRAGEILPQKVKEWISG